MPLTLANVRAEMSWILEKTNTGFKNTKQGQDSLSFELTPDVATFNSLYSKTFTINSASSQTIDLQDFIDMVGTSVVMTKVLGIMLVPSGVNAEVELVKGDTNGLDWILTGTTPGLKVPTGGAFLYFQPTSKVVDATHKTLKFNSTGAGTLTLKVSLIGGT